jgi:hypothetical protein
MTKRLKFKCWNCPKMYFQDLEMSPDPLKGDANEKIVFIVSCPYCGAEAIVDLNPYLQKTRTVMRGDNDGETGEAGNRLPAVLPTRRST